MDPKFGVGEEVANEIEDLIFKMCKKYGLRAKTPPHDIAAWIVRELEKGGKKHGS